MRQHVKRTLQSVSPAAADWISAWRNRQRCRDKYAHFQKLLAARLYPDGDIRVLSGPFEGMAYFNETVWGSITPKWLGSYEEELHGILREDILPRPFPTIVDIGAAEGYYAVGLARAKPDTAVHAFDIDPYARKLQASLAELNQCANLHIHKRCTHAHLNELLAGGGLVISDSEGSEYELLDPERAPSLLRCDMLIEIHDFPGIPMEDIMAEIIARFSATHEPVIERTRERDAARYEKVCELRIDRQDVIEALQEGRNARQYWLWLKRASAA